MSTVNSVKLDWLARRILIELGETNNGKLTTPELKEKTGEQENHKIRYRFEKLRDAGVIQTHQAENGDWAHIPPTVAIITEEGRRILQSDAYDLQAEDEEETIHTKVSRLEAAVNRLEQENTQLKHYVHALDAYLMDEIQIDIMDFGNADRDDLNLHDDEFDFE